MAAQNKLSLVDDVELAAGSVGAVIAVDQVMKTIDSEDHKTSHLFKASVGAAVAVGAYELLRRAEAGGEAIHPKPRSSSPHSKHHSRHILEEIIGAYSLGTELMGDKRHHVAHLVGEAIGATGLLQELRDLEAGEGSGLDPVRHAY